LCISFIYFKKMVEKRKPSERLGDEVDSLRVRDDMTELKRQVLWPKVSKIVEDAIFLSGSYTFYSNVDKLKRQSQIVEYIISWYLKSWRDPELEDEIEKMSHHPMVWKLKYLMDNSRFSLEAILIEIEQREARLRAENARKLEELHRQSEQLNNEEEPSLIAKWWEWLTGKIRWIWSHFVDLADVPEKLWTVFWDMLAKAEEYIWRPYRSGSLDCSWFLSKIFSTWQWKQKMDRWVAKNFADRYKRINRDEIRCGDIIYQAKPAHVELIVSKPYVEKWITYVMTIGSSTDKDNVDPMYDANGKAIRGKTWVWYRRRQIYPHPRHPYQYHRPPYEEWSNNRA